MTDYEKLFPENDIVFHKKKTWLQFNCPYCDDFKFHGAVNCLSGAFTCYRCGRLNSMETMSYLLNLSLNETYILVRKYRLKGQFEEEEIGRPSKIVLPEHNKFSDVQHMRYLKSRKLDEQYLIEKFDIRFMNHLHEFPNRILIPIYFRGRLVSWTSRTVTRIGMPRYISCDAELEVIPHKEVLYNWDASDDEVILVEGPFDVFRLGAGAVASFGTQVTHSQIRLLGMKKKVFIAFDSDEAGRRASKNVARVLSIYTKVEVVEFDEKDIGEMEDDTVIELKSLLNSPAPAIDNSEKESILNT